MHINGNKNNLDAVDWGSLATNLVTTAAGYKLTSLQAKRDEANRRAAEADAAARRAEEQRMYSPVTQAVAPVARRAASAAKQITSSPLIMLGAAGALGALLFLMKRRK